MSRRRQNPRPRALAFLGAALASIVAIVAWRRSAPSSASTGTIQRAIVAARAQIGKPYKWGAAGPDSFDCGGLVWYAWKQAGVFMPRGTAHELFGKLREVAKSDLVPGDMLFYGTAAKLHHVALYIGNGRMIHAPHTGSTVMESPITALPDFYAGGRL